MRIEVDINGNVTEHEDAPIIEQTEQELLQNKLNEAQSYLNNTDWYFARKADTGKEVPTEVVTKRAEAREFIRANK